MLVLVMVMVVVMMVVVIVVMMVVMKMVVVEVMVIMVCSHDLKWNLFPYRGEEIVMPSERTGRIKDNYDWKVIT